MSPMGGKSTFSTNSFAGKLLCFRAWLCGTVQPQTGSHVLGASPPSLPKIELTHMVGVSAKGTMLNAISRSDVTGHWEVTLMKMEWRDFNSASAELKWPLTLQIKKLDLPFHGNVQCCAVSGKNLWGQLHIHRDDKGKHNGIRSGGERM